MRVSIKCSSGGGGTFTRTVNIFNEKLILIKVN